MLEELFSNNTYFILFVLIILVVIIIGFNYFKLHEGLDVKTINSKTVQESKILTNSINKLDF
jgi:hypothetical protein